MSKENVLQKKEPLNKTKGQAISWLVIFVGIAMLANGIMDDQRDHLKEQWPTVLATIYSRSIITNVRYRGPTSYTLHAHYLYKIGAKLYAGEDDIAYATNSQDSNAMWQKYAKGKELSVFVDPTAPEKSIYHLHGGGGDMMLGGLTLCSGLFLLFWVLYLV